MIYLVAVALVLAGFGFVRKMRTNGLRSVLLDTVAAAVLGWVAGLLIGIGARIGMWSIPFFNGAESRITFDGTLQVILVFSLYGIGLGIIYELLFRALLRNRGLLFGLLITVVAAYPLALAALQQISFTPAFLPLVFFIALFVGMMFVPFALSFEFLISRWHRFRESPHSLKSARPIN